MDEVLTDMTALALDAMPEAILDAGADRVDVQVEALPSAVGDRTLLRQVWVNLISNSVKYAHRWLFHLHRRKWYGESTSIHAISRGSRLQNTGDSAMIGQVYPTYWRINTDRIAHQAILCRLRSLGRALTRQNRR